jgi:hypothetical protein
VIEPDTATTNERTTRKGSYRSGSIEIGPAFVVHARIPVIQ